MDDFVTKITQQMNENLNRLGFDVGSENSYLGRIPTPLSSSRTPSTQPETPQSTQFLHFSAPIDGSAITMPGAIWKPTPKRHKRVQTLDTIVLHHTEGGSLSSITQEFLSTSNPNSANFLIGKGGEIIEFAGINEVTNHAGTPGGHTHDHLGRTHMNPISVGIEMINSGSGNDPWPNEQVKACYNIIQFVASKYKIIQIVGHGWVAHGDKDHLSEPTGFPWATLKPLGIPLYYNP